MRWIKKQNTYALNAREDTLTRIRQPTSRLRNISVTCVPHLLSLLPNCKDGARLSLKELEERVLFYQGLIAAKKAEEEGEEDDTEDEFNEYLLIREKDDKTTEELELYLRHHTRNGEPLSDEDKQFIRGMACGNVSQ